MRLQLPGVGFETHPDRFSTFGVSAALEGTLAVTTHQSAAASIIRNLTVAYHNQTSTDGDPAS